MHVSLVNQTLPTHTRHVINRVCLCETVCVSLDKSYLWTDNACHNFHQQSFNCTTFHPLGLLQVHTTKKTKHCSISF